MKLTQEEAKSITLENEALDERFFKECLISKEKIKEMRKFLLDIEDETGEYEDSNICKSDLWGVCPEDFAVMADFIIRAKDIEHKRVKLRAKIRETGYCECCIKHLSEKCKFKDGRCYSNCLNDKKK
jgi:hypothetical protein